MDGPDDDRSLGELAEEDPKLFIGTLKAMTSREDFDEEDMIELATKLAAFEGVNVFRLLQEHPEHAAEFFERFDIPDSLVEKYDRIVAATE